MCVCGGGDSQNVIQCDRGKGAGFNTLWHLDKLQNITCKIKFLKNVLTEQKTKKKHVTLLLVQQ